MNKKIILLIFTVLASPYIQAMDYVEGFYEWIQTKSPHSEVQTHPAARIENLPPEIIAEVFQYAIQAATSKDDVVKIIQAFSNLQFSKKLLPVFQKYKASFLARLTDKVTALNNAGAHIDIKTALDAQSPILAQAVVNAGVNVNEKIASSYAADCLKKSVAPLGHLKKMLHLFDPAEDTFEKAPLYLVPPLNEAAYRNATGIVKILIENGARVDAKDICGKTALDLTTHPEIKKMLKNAAETPSNSQ